MEQRPDRSKQISEARSRAAPSPARRPRLRIRDILPFGRSLPAVPPLDARPDWEQADPRWIRAAQQRSQELPSGGWYVLDASDSFGAQPRRMQGHGLALVVWRGGDDQRLMAARDVCPHMGAALSGGSVCQGKLVCPWHGMAL